MPTILIVEDDQFLGREVNHALGDAGYETFWAKDVKTAQQALESQTIDMVFLDIMLPGDIDGYAFLKQLKADGSAHKKIPVVMMSNLSQMGEIDKAIEIGAKDYVVKSNIDLDKLVELVKTKYLPENS